MIYRDSFHVRQKKSDELWSINYGDLEVESYPLKWTFSENPISALRGTAPPNFYTRLQGLLVHPHQRQGSLLQFFLKGVQNFGGPSPQKISGAKNMQNLARFQTTLKFGSEYRYLFIPGMQYNEVHDNEVVEFGSYS